MIRERVSTQGIIRPLEAEKDIPALQVPLEKIGVITELAVRRYLDGRSKFDKKFSSTIEKIERLRNHNLERAKKDTMRNLAQLQQYLQCEDDVNPDGLGDHTKKGIKEGLAAASGSWCWAWALDCDENPPPSSIVSRRDVRFLR
jgi:hypothetical protein